MIIHFKKDLLPILLGLLLITVSLLTWRLHTGTITELPVLSQALAGYRIVIDAGHGGVDSGAIGASGSLEKSIALAISLETSDLLRQCGAEVTLTRDGDHDLAGEDFHGSIRQRKQRDMPARIEVAENAQADFFISIHTNASTSSRWYGAQVFYQGKSEIGKRAAESIQETINKINKNNTRQAAAGSSYYVLKATSMPSILVETGFISNPEEEKRLLDPEYQKRLAWAIAGGLHDTLTATGAEDLKETENLNAP